MTPTEQDKELRDKVANIVEYWDFSPLQDEDSRIDRLKNEIMQLITADRKRVALEARIDELKKVDMLTKPLLPNSGSVETNVKAWVKDRLPQLKAQQEKK